MVEDPIVAEIRRNRKQHAMRYGNDLDRICKALRERQATSKRKVVIRSPRLRCSRIEKNNKIEGQYAARV